MKQTLVALPDGTVVDAVVGMRSWRITMRTGEPTLRSVYATAIGLDGVEDHHAWPHDRPFRATCRCRGSAGHRADGTLIPGACKGQCGIYSWSDEFFAIEPVTVDSWLHSSILVHGEVFLWGDVHVHERGYRSDFAKVAALWSIPATDGERTEGVARFATLAAERYGAMLAQPPEWLMSRSEQRATIKPCRHGAGCYRCVGTVNLSMSKDLTPDEYAALLGHGKIAGGSALDIARLKLGAKSALNGPLRDIT